MKHFFLPAICLLIFSACCTSDDPDFNFDHDEPKFLRSYKNGDTIYFTNSNNDTDTITIIDIDSAKGSRCFRYMAPRPMGKMCWVQIKHLPTDRWHGVTINGNTNDTTSIDYENLIHFMKDPDAKQTLFDFKFRNFRANNIFLPIMRTDTVKINNWAFTNYYLINHSNPESLTDSSDIEKIIWTEKDGLTAYKNKREIWWIKKQQ